MSTVFIPAVLRPAVGGVKSLELDGATVGELVGALLERTRASAASCWHRTASSTASSTCT